MSGVLDETIARVIEEAHTYAGDGHPLPFDLLEEHMLEGWINRIEFRYDRFDDFSPERCDE